MKKIQPDTLLEQAIDIRAARTLCRDGWSCDQINDVLKNIEITHQQFAAFQEQSKALDELQEVFGPPANSLYSKRHETEQSEIDFLNRGPDAATEVLRENNWQAYEISLVIQDSMFVPLDEPQLAPQAPYYGSREMASFSTATIPNHGGYALSDPHSMPQSEMVSRAVQNFTYASTQASFDPSRQSRRTLKRDTLILAFMAAVALALLFTLL
ncbi:hypothetical protein [Leptothoe sp. PORK10 BA2]|uniref:hypothetical protein n=1 Tax=Leptothoe sp. PORK10 BA2 TaxID=3110254 RepID=UPI002B21D8A9|nr:hypothetical protein [Leptothoe sp. PORK10 BA2]MEA5466464.1 hypothetical protein [Leptothoe sp. PORK10 BA2]